ncbi:unnamed protein product [Lepeophtheirus salmonis]|uniref:(salmon louse) hypothetical protein n=1 Tax=Lepeophtheirus salmonis TaxID=72036 RepID=A0A7R8HAV2_LEPSM|nr:unnamed protein product [Lepeophtheirus salmonis]CAF2975754.1 unnamed protein product [Lepeophtheirus salmonis]
MMIDELEFRDVIQKISKPNEWVHLISVVAEGQKLRLTEDLRKLNEHVPGRSNLSPLPKMQSHSIHQVRISPPSSTSGVEYNHRGDESLAGIDNTEKVVGDIILYDSSMHLHEKNVRKLLDRCRDTEITVNPNKIHCGKTEVKFSGFRVKL